MLRAWDVFCLKPRDPDKFPQVSSLEVEDGVDAQLAEARRWGFRAVLADLREIEARSRVRQTEDLQWLALANEPPGDLPWVSWKPGQVPDLFDPWSRAPQAIHQLPIQVVEETPALPNPKWSIIVPCYRHREEVERTLDALARQTVPRDFFEVVLVEDAEPDDHADISWPELPHAWYRCIRTGTRTWGDHQYRAGSLRNFGVRRARGERILFLDADILLPPQFLAELDSSFERGALIQPLRWNLREPALFSRPPEALDRTRDAVLSEGAAWEQFQLDDTPWSELPRAWKWVSTFCLACDRKAFEDLGGFRESFRHYGLEDLEFGHRAQASGMSLHRLDIDVFHQWTPTQRSEYQGDNERRRTLFKENLERLFAWTPDPELRAWAAEWAL